MMETQTLPPGTVLHGRYRVERALGSGGFGHVYLAIELSTNQPYAIKEYLVTGASGQAQLEHEARVLSRLHHPNLPVFQEAFHERGRYFVVLSYIEGSDLTDYIRVTRQRNEIVPLPRIMTWILSICDAVIFLHSHQPFVIHRDIKPDNIRITPSGTAILVDLGNAKATADGARTLFFIRHQGTPGYAPPEQYPGGTGTDVRSDVYALGGTFFFALTAQEPPSVSTRNQSLQQGQPDLPSLQELVAKNPPEQSAEEKAARQFRLGVSKPSKPAPRHSRHLAQLGSLPPELLDRLNRIIWRAMAMRPKDRYQTVAEFSNDLHGVMATLDTQPPVEPVRPTNPYATEPDLPLIYDAIQQAKEQKEKNQLPPGTQAGASQSPLPTKNTPPAAAPATSPSSQPPPAQAPPSPAVAYCPRCNNVLTPNAAYCASCGLALSRTNPAARPPAEPGKSSRNPSPQNKAPAHDISADQTMVVTPPAQLSAHTPITGDPSMAPDPAPRKVASSSTPAISQDISRASSNAPLQQLVLPGASYEQKMPVGRSSINIPSTPAIVRTSTQRPAAGKPASPACGTGFGMQASTIVIAIAILVVLLIALIFFLVFTLKTGNHPSFIEAQLISYGRTLSLSIVSATTPASVRIRACRAFFYPTHGDT